MVNDRLKRLKNFDCYGVQIDHWTNFKGKNVLLIFISVSYLTGLEAVRANY